MASRYFTLFLLSLYTLCQTHFLFRFNKKHSTIRLSFDMVKKRENIQTIHLINKDRLSQIHSITLSIKSNNSNWTHSLFQIKWNCTQIFSFSILLYYSSLSSLFLRFFLIFLSPVQNSWIVELKQVLSVTWLILAALLFSLSLSLSFYLHIFCVPRSSQIIWPGKL